MEHTAKQEGLQVSTELSTVCEGCLEQFLAPLLLYLDQFLDKRLVRRLAQLVRVIIVFRHNRQGLLLSELGGYLLSPAHAPAGTKRISNLLHSPRWSYHVLERFLWRRAEQQLPQWEKTGQDVLAVWDESVLEKPESETLEGLCAVRSSRAARLKHIRPGFYNPPGGRPVFVPGLQWLGLLLLPYQGPPVLAAMRWWTRRGAQASDRRTEELPCSTNVRKPGGHPSCMSAIAVLLVAPGSRPCWIAVCVLCCAGRSGIPCWMKTVSGARRGRSPGDGALGGSVSSRTPIGANGARPGS